VKGSLLPGGKRRYWGWVRSHWREMPWGNEGRGALISCAGRAILVEFFDIGFSDFGMIFSYSGGVFFFF